MAAVLQVRNTALNQKEGAGTVEGPALEVTSVLALLLRAFAGLRTTLGSISLAEAFTASTIAPLDKTGSQIRAAAIPTCEFF